MVEQVKSKWSSKDLVRIGTIGDGSCFFHAFLKGFYPKYQNTPFYDDRFNIVREFRNELGSYLKAYIPGSSIQVYDAISNGELAALGVVEDLDIFSLKGLTDLLYSENDVGDEIYSYVADLIGVDVIVFRGTKSNLNKHFSTVMEDVIRPIIMIVGNQVHYELIAIREGLKIKTLFMYGDEIYDQLRLM